VLLSRCMHRVLIYETRATDSYSQLRNLDTRLLKRAFQLEPSTKGALEVSKHRHLCAIVFECCAYFRKNSVVSSPLYLNCSRVLALAVIIRASGCIRVRNVGFLSEWNKARNDLAFDTKDGFLYHPSQFIVTQILRTFLKTFRKTNIIIAST